MSHNELDDPADQAAREECPSCKTVTVLFWAEYEGRYICEDCLAVWELLNELQEMQ